MNKTVNQLWRLAARRIESATPELDARLLLAHAIDKDISWLLTWPEYQLTGSELRYFNACIKKRRQGMPVAYILGVQEFWSLTFKVTPDTLIPRADTECLVEEILQQYDHTTINILDVGTGTGAIAIALASERPLWHLLATDISCHALGVAQENITAHKANISVVCADWLQVFAAASVDVIVSNPPYIKPTDRHLNALAYEPLTALVADSQGLSDIEQLCRQASTVLRPDGKLFIEHGYDQKIQVSKLFQRFGYRQITCKQDYAGNDRFTYGIKGARPA